MDIKSSYANLDGVPSAEPRGDGLPYFTFDLQGAWRVSAGSKIYDIEGVCVRLHEAFKQAVMKDTPYEALIYRLPQFISITGHNSESPMGRDDFERGLQLVKDFPCINRFLYLYDCQHLVASIQECTKEIEHVMGEFYSSLNFDNLFYPPIIHEDSTRYTSSPITAKLVSFLNFIFIRLHSLLDYTVKVAYESEHLKINFERYPRLSSNSLQYGDRKRVSFNGAGDTLFEPCQFMTTIETIRNHLIHDAFLDDMPKAYERFKGGKVVEKFILFPDITEGRFDRYVNRNLFFGTEDKINLRLPNILFEFQQRQIETLERILEPLRALGRVGD